jgi:hypothetical protein
MTAAAATLPIWAKLNHQVNRASDLRPFGRFRLRGSEEIFDLIFSAAALIIARRSFPVILGKPILEAEM